MNKIPIVMKFGGTSVENSKAILSLISIVKSKQETGFLPVLVLSAMGKTTNKLLKCGLLAKENKLNEAKEIIRDDLRTHHFNTIGVLLKNAPNEEELRRKTDLLFEEIKNLLTGIALLGELTNRALDSLLSYGERLSTLLVTEALNFHGVKAELCDSRKILVTNSDFSKATPDFIETKINLETKIKPVFEQGLVPVLQGFIGSNKEGFTTTIGRGGSDFSAAIFGALLCVSRIEIWTDVNGVLTTDPNFCLKAKTLENLSFAEASELAYFGAKVLHPSTIRPAIEKEIPVFIFNSKEPQNKGTKITKITEQNDVFVKSIACKKNVVFLSVSSSKTLFNYEFLGKVFEIFAKFKTSVDVVTTSEAGLSLVFEEKSKLDKILGELKEIGEVKISEEKGLLCVVGERLFENKQTLEKILQKLSGFKICLMSQGASKVVLSFVLESSGIEEAVKILHKEFFETS
ncbi:lysine-sensitive aspartokinase 3 [bacterium]|nr:lysine-sensitive aspartokinase 3 [bacterium]